jgi:hypothetical protein
VLTFLHHFSSHSPHSALTCMTFQTRHFIYFELISHHIFRHAKICVNKLPPALLLCAAAPLPSALPPTSSAHTSSIEVEAPLCCTCHTRAPLALPCVGFPSPAPISILSPLPSSCQHRNPFSPISGQCDSLLVSSPPSPSSPSTASLRWYAPPRKPKPEPRARTRDLCTPLPLDSLRSMDPWHAFPFPTCALGPPPPSLPVRNCHARAYPSKLSTKACATDQWAQLITGTHHLASVSIALWSIPWWTRST